MSKTASVTADIDGLHGNRGFLHRRWAIHMFSPAISLVFTPAWVLWSMYVTWFVTGDHEPVKGIFFCIFLYISNWLVIFVRTDIANEKRKLFFLFSAGVFVLSYFFCAFYLRAFEENSGFGLPYRDDWLGKIHNSSQVLVAMAITASAAFFASAAMYYPVHGIENTHQPTASKSVWTKDQVIAIIGLLVSIIGVVISCASFYFQK